MSGEVIRSRGKGKENTPQGEKESRGSGPSQLSRLPNRHSLL